MESPPGFLECVDTHGLRRAYRWARFLKALLWVSGASLAATSTRPAHGGLVWGWGFQKHYAWPEACSLCWEARSRDLALSLLSWVMRRFSSLRSGLCSYSRRFCSLASTSAGVGSTRGFGFFTFWLALADFLLDLGLFGVRMTKVLSKMRSLELPGWAVAWRENPRSPRLLHS